MDNIIVSRIQKLMALANNNSNEAEAALAMSRVQDLLMDHGLSMAEVSIQQEKTHRPIDGGKRTKEGHKSAAMYEYQRKLMETLCRNNFLQYWTEERFKLDSKGKRSRYNKDTNEWEHGRWVRTHILLGREENVMATQVMYDYLIETMDRLLPWQGMQKRGKEALLWLAGCTERLTERLTEVKREKERRQREAAAAAPQTAGLVLYSKVYENEEDLNNDFRCGYEPGHTAREKEKNRARWAEQNRKIEALVLQGMDRDDAWYVANGIQIPEKIQEKPETEAEREKRKRREKREQEQSEARWERRQQKEWEKRRSAAFQQGLETAEEIGLHDQIDNRKGKGVLA